ncbi:MAG: UDP-N-acetylmuramoyl-L-alanyl-D-glutamate--2,6-diaminopimelate ligase [Waddliaceae bacterium]
MKLKQLLKGIPVQQVRGPQNVDITGVCAHSKRIAPGNLFVAKKGRTVDGVSFIPEAIASGATAILTDFFDPTLKSVAQIIHSDVSAMEGLLAAQYYQHPSREMLMVGITGTNGKTTTSYAIKHMLDRIHGPCGLIGTIAYRVGERCHQAELTTPDVTANQKMLREMVRNRCRSAVMEVSSHALDQGRVRMIDFDVAIFTNLTREHLDYHGTMEKYALAKRELFRQLNSGSIKEGGHPSIPIVNADDPHHRDMISACSADALTFGITQSADVQASHLELTAHSIRFDVNVRGRGYPVFLPLIGRFNVYNSLACIACGVGLGYSVETVLQSIQNFSCVPGRVEPVPNPLNLNIYVDFAHKPDALDNVLSCLKTIHSGRLFVVFGCGGDRDRSKRPIMAQICELHADFCFVTTDNPRTEDPDKILREITEGFSNSSKYLVEPDRRQAIEQAIRQAAPGDLVLIAGRGHESYQIFAHHTVDFDDRRVAGEICQAIKEER